MAMIKHKRITFSLVLVCLIAVSPMANAQLGGLLGSVGNIFNINGLVMCTLNAAPIGTSALPFVNATVQLRCGSNNNLVVANSTTDANGLFSISTSNITLPILPNCIAVLQTPLSSCNPSLPSTVGGLFARIIPISTILTGLVTSNIAAITSFARI